jgi:Tol biopolymer transport system component/DNA-binding winged helix-turn-helix (wHTH) protein
MSLCFGEFELDPERRLLLRAGVPVPLEPKAYELLSLLLERRPRALSRAQIRDVIWPDTHVSESTLAVVVTGIRQALGDDARRPRFIRTVHGFGYAFCGEARSMAGPCPDAAEAAGDGGAEDRGDDPAGGAQANARASAGESSRAPLLARWPWVVATAVALAMLSAGWQLLGARRPTAAEEPPPRVVPLTSLPGAELHPALSPDGSRVAFIWNGPDRDNFDAYVKEIASGEMRRVTTDPAPDYHPVWSPDGNHLAFVRHVAEGATLFLVAAAGGREQRLTEVAVPDWFYQTDLAAFWLDWSPNGRYLALPDRALDGSGWGINLVSVETGEKRAVTSTASTADRFPTFSPDGRKLAFLRGGFYAAKADLFVLPLSNGATPPAAAGAAVAVRGLTIGPIAWLPSGNELVVGEQRVSLDGSPPRPFVLPGRPLQPNFEDRVSIRGTRVAFSTPEYRKQLLRVPLGRAGPVTPAAFLYSTRGEQYPAIASDGHRVAFTSWRSGDGHIWVGDVAGSAFRELALPPGSAYASSASWSPDGRRLAFDALFPGEQSHVFVAAPDAGTLRRLTSERTDDARPRWSRDGRWIYFASTRSGNLELWKVPADAEDENAEPVRITQNGGMEAEESPDGRYLYYAKRQDPGLFRVPLGVPGAGEEERVLDFGGEGRWQLGSRGIYVLHVRPGHPPTIRLRDFATQAESAVVEVQIGPEWTFDRYGGAFVLAPDEQWALLTAQRVDESDLYLVEGFR